MKNTILLVLLSLSIGIPYYTFSWGVTGHRVVGEVASQYLNEKAAQNIKRVLGHKTLAEVSNFLDDIKSDSQLRYDTLNVYHYVSVPDGMTYAASNKNPKGDAIMGLNTAVEKLKEGNLSREDEAYYLKIVIHLVGDLHQPLHVGRVDDAGGNHIKFKWFGDATNLHSVWDSKILNDKLYSYTELTALINHPTLSEVHAWQTSTLEDWVKECQDLRPSIYDFDVEARSWEYKYMYKHWDTMQHQLLKGGVRLAGILNEIYG